MKNALLEVENILAKQAANKERQLFLQNYMKSKLTFHAVSTPLQRNLHKEGFSFYHPRDFSKATAFATWEHIWLHSQNFETMNQSLFFLETLKKEQQLLGTWPQLETWAHRIENWAHSDGLSNIFASMLEQNKALIFPTLCEWNSHDNPWLRRQSIVSLYYYSAHRKVKIAPRVALPLVKNLLLDNEYYVQKGVGWTLREIGNFSKDSLLDFLNKNLNSISSIAITAAMEKLTEPEKSHFKEKRKILRRK